MSHSMDTNTSRALIIGASKFPKDENLANTEKVIENLKLFSEVLKNEKIIGLSDQQVDILEDTKDNTAIKEQIALSAEQGGSTLIFYYSGNIVIRKGQLYLATVNSSLKQVHVNGIALVELMALLSESETTNKIVIFDSNFIHAMKGFSEDTEALIKNVFNHFEEEYPDTYFISSPSNNYNLADQHNFTDQLVDILSSGIPEEKGTLTLKDLHDKMKEVRDDGNRLHPIFGKKSKKSSIAFAFNHQFIKYRDLRKQAEKLFEEGNYQEVLPLYREASQLFPDNEHINKKLQFTSHFLLANELFNQKEYAEAKKNYEEALNFFDLPIVFEKINECIEKLASYLYDQSDYEQALPYYDYLVKQSENNVFYNRRLKVCQDEIRFTELIDKADRAYFQDNYTKALQFYNAALEINMDNLIIRRKEECERFIEKEKNLREKLKKEIEQEILGKQQAVIDDKISGEKEKLKEKLQSQETEFLAKAREEASKAFEGKIEAKLEEIEAGLWKRLSIWNDIEGYKFYLDFFSEGKYVKKAKKRIKQLEERQNITPIDDLGIEKEVSSDLNGTHKNNEETERDKKEDSKSLYQPEKISLADLIKPTSHISEEDSMIDPSTDSEEEDETIEAEVKTELTEVVEETENVGAESIELEKAFEEEVTANAKEEITQEANEVDAIPQNATEEELWDYACNANTVASYMNYINNTKESIYIAEAYNKVGELSRIESDEEEISSGEEAKPENTPEQVAVDETPKAEEKEVIEEESEEIISSTIEASDNHTVEEEPASNSETKSEDQLWAKAKDLDTVAAYMEYIEVTSDGEHISNAYYRINQLNSDESEGSDSNEDISSNIETTATEIEAKQEATFDSQKEDPITEKELINGSVDSPIETSSPSIPNGVHTEIETVATAVHSTSGDIEEETLWQRAKAEDTVSAYFNYMNKTTDKRYWDLAKERIGELKNNSQSQELQDWTNAQEEDTVESYKKYIRKYPLGNYYAKAMFRLNRLES